jgi:hypothetical protein
LKKKNLPPVSTTIAKLVAKFAAGVADTGGKFAAGVVDTGGKTHIISLPSGKLFNNMSYLSTPRTN